MTSTYTSNLVLELQTSGENDNNWGVLANANFTLLDKTLTADLSKSVAGSSNVTLTAAEFANIFHDYTGALTGNIDVIYPTTQKLFAVKNSTSGAYTLTVKPSGGSGVVVTQGDKVFVYNDGATCQLISAAGIENFLLGNGLTRNSDSADTITASADQIDIDITDAADTVITALDRLLFADQTDSDLTKQDQVQGIIDLVPGLQTVFIPSNAMTAATTNGCGGVASTETTALRPDIIALPFDGAADEHAQFSFTFPKSWDEGTLTYRARWASSGAVSTGVAIALMAVAVSDNDTIDVAFGTAIVVTDDNGGTAEVERATATSAALTVAGTPAAGDRVNFDVYRDVSDANDDMTQDMLLIGIELFFTTDAVTDA